MRHLALISVLAMNAACLPANWLFDDPSWDDDDDGWDDDEWDDDDEWEDDGEQDDPPSLDIELDTQNGIMGPSNTITVSVDDDDTLSLDVSLAFARNIDRQVDSGDRVTITGAELGEGYGDLLIEVFDRDGGNSSTSVEGLLIDLTAPLLEVEPCVLSASGKGDRGTLAAWIGDAWALGSVAVEVVPDNGGDIVVFADSFGDWPSTFGESWDWSYFSVNASELPVGRSLATYTVRDRAGNATSRSCDLFVDALPPVVTLEAELVDGFIYAAVSASDDDDTALPTGLVLRAGGADVAHGQAPSTSFVLDAADFPSGVLILEAAARDRAGNEGRSPIVALSL
jgi:hypothetical protein